MALPQCARIAGVGRSTEQAWGHPEQGVADFKERHQSPLSGWSETRTAPIRAVGHGRRTAAARAGYLLAHATTADRSSQPSSPRPDRIRARARVGPALRWWRRIPWVHIGAVLGAMAAVGGLVLTGIATHYGAATARDQLDQSRKEAQEESRKQAERIWSWGQWHDALCVPSSEEEEGESPADTPSTSPCEAKNHIDVANRSADPVYDVWVRFAVDEHPTEGDPYLEIGDMAHVPRWFIGPATYIKFSCPTGNGNGWRTRQS